MDVRGSLTRLRSCLCRPRTHRSQLLESWVQQDDIKRSGPWDSEVASRSTGSGSDGSADVLDCTVRPARSARQTCILLRSTVVLVQSSHLGKSLFSAACSVGHDGH